MEWTNTSDGAKSSIAVVEDADYLLRRINSCSEPLSIGVGDGNLVDACTICRNGIGGCSCIGDGSAALEPLVGVVGIGCITIRITSDYRSTEGDSFLECTIAGDGCRSAIAVVGGCC